VTVSGVPSTIEVAPVRDGEDLDWGSLESYLRREIPDLDGPFSVLQFPHGSANLTYRVSIGDRQMVVRRPPMGHIALGAHDMGREYRALAGLWAAYDRAPRPLAHCGDPGVVGAEFLVVEYRPGVVIHDVESVPPAFAETPDHGRRLGLAVVDALVDLHLVDIEATGLAALGRPDGFLERQLRGWSARWEAVAEAGPPHPVMTALATRLLRDTPRSPPPTVVHNDFKLNNCQFSAVDPNRVTSVFDWDMATVGDPLADLGTLLNYWPDPTGDDSRQWVAFPGLEPLGLPPRESVIEHYAAGTGIDVEAAPWYEAYGAWKTCVIMQQLYARWAQGETTDERMGTRADRLDRVAQRVLELLEEWRP
jgi:aminoglycoside phosphotransferase (APT) family kinase protein